MEIGLPIAMQFLRYRKYLSSLKAANKVNEENKLEVVENERNISDIVPHSYEHQMLCTIYDDIIEEYSDMLIQFGYVTLFGVAAPLTPLLIFVLVYLEKFVDTFKFFFLLRVNLLDQSNGIEIYKSIIQAFIYLGLITNIAIIVFGDPEFLPEKDIYYKIVIYAGVVIFIFMITKIISWNIIPKWFNLLNEIKELYQKKYYHKEFESLGHIRLSDNMR